MKVNVIQDPRKPLPAYATKGAACVDISVSETKTIKPNETEYFKTGLRVEIPDSYVLMLFERSSLHKKHLKLANSVGIIDSDFRGEIVLAIQNTGTIDYTVEFGERLVQGMLQKVEKIEWIKCDKLSETKRGDGGFGSTGQ